jgi:pimeloyl-ACP methyl ester carboxylesterase
MNFITTKDGARVFYKDWGRGQPIVFSDGWPLNADAWDDQLVAVASKGLIAASAVYRLRPAGGCAPRSDRPKRRKRQLITWRATITAAMGSPIRGSQ